MKNILNIIGLILSTSFAAQTVSLETVAQCIPGSCPTTTYVKDVNNLLDKYVGTWKGSLNGKNFEFNFIKRENFGFEDYLKKDRLIGRLKITNSNGVVEFDNFAKQDSKLDFYGDNFQKDLKMYLMRFRGGKIDCIDSGYTYLRIKPETPNNMSISFLPDIDIVTQDCSNFKTTFPTEKVINLIRQ